jgi:hypothetical protein
MGNCCWEDRCCGGSVPAGAAKTAHCAGAQQCAGGLHSSACEVADTACKLASVPLVGKRCLA